MLPCHFKHFWGIAAYSYRLPFLSCVCSTWAPRPSSWLELEPVHTRHSKLSNSSRLVVVVMVPSFPGPCALKYTVRGKPVSKSNGGVDKSCSRARCLSRFQLSFSLTWLDTLPMEHMHDIVCRAYEQPMNHTGRISDNSRPHHLHSIIHMTGRSFSNIVSLHTAIILYVGQGLGTHLHARHLNKAVSPAYGLWYWYLWFFLYS